MSERTRNGLIITVMILMAALLAFLVTTEPTGIDRVQAIGARIKCPVCQGESIADSPSQMARDMMDLVAERVDQGATDEQIIDEILGSYSGALLLDPPTRGNTLLLWVLPVVALAVGIVVILWWKRHPGEDTEATGGHPPGRSRARLIVGGLILAGALIGIAYVAAGSFQDQGVAASGVADLADQDLDEVSVETLEAVVAANADHPDINGMRLALAERYFAAGDYGSAFPHYLAVAESPDATSPEEPDATGSQRVTALVRLAWMVYDGNDEVETALGLLDDALDVDPGSTAALYVKGQVSWCGLGDAGAAIALFEQVLENESLPEASRHQVEADLEAVERREACP